MRRPCSPRSSDRASTLATLKGEDEDALDQLIEDITYSVEQDADMSGLEEITAAARQWLDESRDELVAVLVAEMEE